MTFILLHSGQKWIILRWKFRGCLSTFLEAAKAKKLSHYTPWRRLGGEGYSSYSYSTSALDGGEWSASRLGRALAPGKGPPVSIVQEAGWAPEPVWTKRP
jgi:hypothetical protein